MELSIRLADLADDGDLVAVGRLDKAANDELFGASEDLSPAQLRAKWRDSEYATFALFVAELSGEVVGFVQVEAPLTENLDRVYLFGAVTPAWRRRGIGTALADAAVAHGEAIGRPKSQMWGIIPDGADPEDPGLPGPRIARHLGLARRGINICRAAPIPIDPRRVDHLRASLQGRLDGYELISWRAPTAPDKLVQLARLMSQLEQDAPREDSVSELPVWTAERVKEYEDRNAAGGYVQLFVAARTAVGELVGFSSVIVHAGEGTTCAWQEDTIVVAEHRGHSLGVAMKLATHVAVADDWPRVRQITTWNSNVNEHMIAGNEALGYSVLLREGIYQD